MSREATAWSTGFLVGVAAAVLLVACSDRSPTPAAGTVPPVAGVGNLPAAPSRCVLYGAGRPLPDPLPVDARYIEIRELGPVTVDEALCLALGTVTPPCMAPDWHQCETP